MTVRRIYVYGMPEPSRYTLVRGHVSRWLVEQRIPAQWTPRLKGYAVRTERIGDLIARAEQDGYSVRMKGQVRS